LPPGGEWRCLNLAQVKKMRLRDGSRPVTAIALTPPDATCGVALNTARFSNADYDRLLDERAPVSCELEPENAKEVEVPRNSRASFPALILFSIIVGGSASAGAQTFLTFHCGDGTEFVAAFYRGTRSAYLQLDGKSMTLPRRTSLSGERYSAGDITLRVREHSATLSRGRYLSRNLRSTECSSN
jgi:membrane-bound inhibitor of C-type lysozyme